MPVTTQSTPKRYRGGKTLDVAAWEASEDKPLSILEVRQLLGIRTRKTINLYLKELGLFGLKQLNWQQIRDVTGMHLWLRANYGQHSRRQYVALKAKELETQALALHGIDLDKVMEELKNAANQTQSTDEWTQAS